MWTHRRICSLLLVLAVLFIGTYFEPTHCVRGWLWREAFYEGRPMSYWRSRCDDWLLRFDTPKAAAEWIPPGIAVPVMQDAVLGEFQPIRPRAQNLWTRLTDRFRSPEDQWQEDWPPRVLFGYSGAEPVLEELVQEPKKSLWQKNWRWDRRLAGPGQARRRTYAQALNTG